MEMDSINAQERLEDQSESRELEFKQCAILPHIAPIHTAVGTRTWLQTVLTICVLKSSCNVASWRSQDNIPLKSSYIAQYPVLRIAQSAFTFYLPGRPIQTPAQLLWEAICYN